MSPYQRWLGGSHGAIAQENVARLCRSEPQMSVWRGRCKTDSLAGTLGYQVAGKPMAMVSMHPARVFTRLVNDLCRSISGAGFGVVGSIHRGSRVSRPKARRTANHHSGERDFEFVTRQRVTDPTSGFRCLQPPDDSSCDGGSTDDYPKPDSAVVMLHRAG